MRILLRSVATVAMLLFAVCAHADTTSKQRRVGELLVTMGLEEETSRQLRAQEASFRALPEQQMADSTPDAEQRKAFEDFRTQVFRLLWEAGQWIAIKDDYVQLYSDTYSEEEVDACLRSIARP